MKNITFAYCLAIVYLFSLDILELADTKDSLEFIEECLMRQVRIWPSYMSTSLTSSSCLVCLSVFFCVCVFVFLCVGLFFWLSTCLLFFVYKLVWLCLTTLLLLLCCVFLFIGLYVFVFNHNVRLLPALNSLSCVHSSQVSILYVYFVYSLWHMEVRHIKDNRGDLDSSMNSGRINICYKSNISKLIMSKLSQSRTQIIPLDHF